MPNMTIQPQLTPPAKTIPTKVTVDFDYNPPGIFGKGPKQLTVLLTRVDDRLVVNEARISRGIPSDIFQTSPRRLFPRMLDPNSPGYNSQLKSAADALSGAMTVLIPELRSKYPPQARPHVDTGIGWANKTYNVSLRADTAGEVNVWGTYKKHHGPAVEQAALALTEFGQTLWKEGYHKF